MNIKRIVRRFFWDCDDTANWSNPKSPRAIRAHLSYAYRQTRAAIYQHMHLLSESARRYPKKVDMTMLPLDVSNNSACAELDYPDPDDPGLPHEVVACLCGKEWS